MGKMFVIRATRWRRLDLRSLKLLISSARGFRIQIEQYISRFYFASGASEGIYAAKSQLEPEADLLSGADDEKKLGRAQETA
jgi:hypothetical protein